MRTTWLDQAVPVRLGDEMTEFRQTMGLALGFSETLDGLGWEGSSDLLEWVESCAKIWLKKRREHCLDLVRNRLAIGKLGFLYHMSKFREDTTSNVFWSPQEKN